jgi:hypothetical protein
MRTFSTSIMAALVIAALFWGNCFSCPLVLAAPAHPCCPHTKAPAPGCDLQVLQHFVKVDSHAQAVPIVATVTAGLVQPQLADISPAAQPVAPDNTPPPTISLRV